MTDFNEIYEKYSAYHVSEYPVKHKRKDNLSSINVKVSKDNREKILKIREMDRQLGDTMLSFGDYAELVSDAHSSNVHWTTKIEGNPIPLNEVKRSSRILLDGGANSMEADPGPKQEILNHLFSYLYKNDVKLPWNIDFISNVHKSLMDGVGGNCTPGEIRTRENIQVNTENGQTSFIACPAPSVTDELNALLGWLDDSPFDPVVTAVVFFHEFESIHPFTDGNGRIGRSLFHLLMQELGFRNFNLCVIDVKLLGNAATYYSLMEYTDKTGDYTPIVSYFIDCIFSAYSEALESFSEKDLLKGMDEYSKVIAKNARSCNSWFSLRDANTWVSGLSDQSIRVRLDGLMEKDLLEKKGITRSTVFRFKDPFRELKKKVAENMKK